MSYQVGQNTWADTQKFTGALWPSTETVSAAGTNQSGATALADRFVHIVSTVASGAGVRLVAIASCGPVQYIVNTGANDLLVYPSGSETINGGAASAAITIPSGAMARIAQTTSSAWQTGALTSNGLVPIAGGGTGSATKNFVDLSTNQASIAGNKTFTGILSAGSGPTTLTDAAGKILSAALNTVAIANGGTGATSASAARGTLGAAASGANADITGISSLTGTLDFSGASTGNAIIKAPSNQADGLQVIDAASNIFLDFITTTGSLSLRIAQALAIQRTTTVGIAGVSNAVSATDWTMSGANAVAGGTNDLTGTSITINTGQGLGQAASTVVFNVSTRAGSSNSTLQALTEVVRFTNFDATLSNKGLVCAGGIRIAANSLFSGGLVSAGSITIANGGQLYFNSSTSGNNKFYFTSNKAIGLRIGDDSTTNDFITLDSTTGANLINLLKDTTLTGVLTAVKRTQTAKTGNYTLTTADSRKTFSNSGASGTVVFTLPTWAAGLEYRLFVAAAQTLSIKGASSDQIYLGASLSTATTGDVNSNTVGSVLTLEATVSGKWAVSATTGTWAAT